MNILKIRRKKMENGKIENAKKNNKIIAAGVSCLFVVVALVVFIIYQNQQIKKLSVAMNKETTTDKLPVAKPMGQEETVQKNALQKHGSASTGEGDDLKYQLDAAEEEIDMANKKISDEAAKKADNSKNLLELQKKMLQDPAYKKMLRNTYKGTLDTYYGALFKKLNLSTEKQDGLKELLLDQMMATMDISQEMLSSEPSEQKRKELQQKMSDMKKENDTKISAFLGSQDFKIYEAYRDTLTERQLAEGFAETLGANDKLTEAQQEALIESMYNERKNVYAQQNWAEDRVTFSSEINDDGIAKMIDMNDRTNDGYIKGAGAILSVSQIEQLKAFIKQRRDMTESALKVSAQMLGGQTAQKNAKKN
jgi:hypothetical protein